MPVTPPFNGLADLATGYGSVDGAAEGTFRTTIPDNFSKVKNEVLGLHGRLLSVEGSNAAAALTRDAVGVNESFQVRRWGPRGFVQFAGSSTQFRWRPGAFIAPYTDGDGNGFVAAGAGSHYKYVHSLFSGWMMASDVFSDIGSEISAGQQLGARFTFDDAATYYNSMQQSDPAGYVFGGTGDLPGFYQVLTRHIPIEQLQYQPLTLHLRYSHTAAIPAAVTYRLYISWCDGTRRYDAVSPVLTSTTDVSDVIWGTGSDTNMFPDGVIPLNATSVEVGLVQASRSGTYGTDDWDIYGFMVDVGSARNVVSVQPWALDYATAAHTYAQTFGPDTTGRTYVMDHPLIQAGATVPTGGTIGLEEHYSWALCMPWRKVTTTLVPDCRVLTVIGAVADGVDPTYLLDAALDTASISVVEDGYYDANEPFDQRGIVSSLNRTVMAQPGVGSQMLRRIDMPMLQWFGELHCVLSPIGY